jgi:hypothetical protein
MVIWMCGCVFVCVHVCMRERQRQTFHYVCLSQKDGDRLKDNMEQIIRGKENIKINS